MMAKTVLVYVFAVREHLLIFVWHRISPPVIRWPKQLLNRIAAGGAVELLTSGKLRTNAAA
ncbi:MAG: hypothetical protein WBB00_11400 [Mycobacterium sp.]